MKDLLTYFWNQPPGAVHLAPALFLDPGWEWLLLSEDYNILWDGGVQLLKDSVM